MEPADYQPFAPEVHAFVDGRLDAESERDFTRRMHANPQLRRQVEELRGALAVLHGLPAKEPPENFKHKVIGRIREEELAERARVRITSSPTPLWQHFVHAAAGAVAAALLLAFLGFPSFRDAPGADGGVDGRALGAMPAEEDLLPVLGDQFERFDSLRRQISIAVPRDADLQRQLLRIELESSGLARRNAWLGPEVAALPPERGLPYSRFLESLDAALLVLDDEVSASAGEGRAVNLARVRAALDAVETPAALRGGYRLAARGTLPDRHGNIATPGSPEMQHYASMRRADYRHDPQGMLLAAEELLAVRAHGVLADHARAAKIAALLRLDLDVEAARYLVAEFATVDRDMSPQRQAVLLALVKPEEMQRLHQARRAMTGE